MDDLGYKLVMVVLGMLAAEGLLRFAHHLNLWIQKEWNKWKSK